MVILWTDGLIFFLLTVIVLLSVYLRGKEHLQRPLAQIVRFGANAGADKRQGKS